MCKYICIHIYIYIYIDKVQIPGVTLMLCVPTPRCKPESGRGDGGDGGGANKYIKQLLSCIIIY